MYERSQGSSTLLVENISGRLIGEGVFIFWEDFGEGKTPESRRCDQINVFMR